MAKNGASDGSRSRKLPATPYLNGDIHVNQHHNPRKRFNAHHASVDSGALASDHGVELVNHAHAPVHHSNLVPSLDLVGAATAATAALQRIEHRAQNDAVRGPEADLAPFAEDFAWLGEGYVGGVWVVAGSECENRTEETAELVVREGGVAGHRGEEPERMERN